MKNLLRSAFPRAALPLLAKKQLSNRQPLIALHLGGHASWGARDYSALAREGYQKNAIVYRCIRLISEAAASVPLCVRRGDICDAGDPAERFLARGNPGATPTEILESFYGYLQVGGNAYLEAALVDGVPSALYALRPDRVCVIKGRDGWPAGYEYEAGGLSAVFAVMSRLGVWPFTICVCSTQVMILMAFLRSKQRLKPSMCIMKADAGPRHS